MKILIRTAIALSFLLFIGHLNASVIVAGTDPSTSSGFYVENNGTSEFSFEQEFTLTSAVDVSSFSVNAASFTTQTLRAELYSGTGLGGTGTLLETFDFSVAGGFSGFFSDVPSLSIARNFSLSIGNYAILFTHPQILSNLIYLNSADSSVETFGTLGGTNWSTGITGGNNIVFSLEGTEISPVPIPAAAWLFGTALIGLVGFGRRKARIAA